MYSFKPGVLYFVDVTTGSESKSGTPSRVFLKLIGEKGEHGEVELGTQFDRGRLVQMIVYVNRGQEKCVKDNYGLHSKRSKMRNFFEE